MIQRRPEGRTNRLFLTEEGRRVFAEVVPAHENLIDEHLSALSREEQTQLFELLRKLDRALDGKSSAVDDRRDPKAVDRKLQQQRR